LKSNWNVAAAKQNKEILPARCQSFGTICENANFWKEKYEEAQTQLSSNSIGQLNTEIRYLERQFLDSEQRCADLQNQNAELEETIAVLKQDEADLEWRYAVLQRQNAEFEKKMATLKKKEVAEDLEQRCANLRRQLAGLEKTMATLKKKEADREQFSAKNTNGHFFKTSPESFTKGNSTENGPPSGKRSFGESNTKGPFSNQVTDVIPVSTIAAPIAFPPDLSRPPPKLVFPPPNFSGTLPPIPMPLPRIIRLVPPPSILRPSPPISLPPIPKNPESGGQEKIRRCLLPTPPETETETEFVPNK